MEAIGVTELTLSNGVKVILKPTDFKADEILMSAYSAGGNSLYPVEKYPSALFADDIISQSGIKDFSATDLQKFLSDKKRGRESLHQRVEGRFEGQRPRPKTWKQCCNLTHLYFTALRKDEAACSGIYVQAKSLFCQRDV